MYQVSLSNACRVTVAAVTVMLEVCATLSLWCLECFHAAGCGCGGEMVEGVVNSKSMQRMLSLQESLVCQRSRAPQLAVAFNNVFSDISLNGLKSC